MIKCRICNNTENLSHYKAKEMMFGIREEFDYFQCPKCDCLQITEIPESLDKYYPSNYYSFNVEVEHAAENTLRDKMIRRRNKYAILKKGLLNGIIFNKYPTDIFEPISQAKLKTSDSVLDVGCGNGKLLQLLKEAGFSNLTGVDPFITKDIEKNGIKIHKKFISEMSGKWDFIMMNHAFEHVPNPLETLQKIGELLSENGTAMIRVPVASSYAWEHYRENWVQLDAPRHFFLHTEKSMEVLAEQSGLKIEKIFFDSGEFQFWGSEQYIKNIPLVSSESYKFNKKNSIFTQEQLADFKRKAVELNRTKKGDMCAFYLKKK